MKRISEFILTEGRGFFISLLDQKLSIAVSPNDGDIQFHEGIGTDRFNGYFVAGKRVDKFEVTRVQGMIGVVVYYKGASPHILGFTNDQESAQAWVDRVNRVYAQKRDRLKEREEGFRIGGFQEYPVVHDILIDGNIVLPGDYAQSKAGHPVPIYKPHWQEYYVTQSVANLKEETKYAGEIKTLWQTPSSHRYPHLAERIKYRPKTVREYGERVTQPLELIFDCGPRRDKIAVIPLAQATRFALVYVKNAAPAAHLNLRSQEFPMKSLADWIPALTRPTKKGRSVVVCTYTDTSVDYLFDGLVFDGLVDRAQRISVSTVPGIADWLWRFAQDGIIACDIGLAYQILGYWVSTGYPHELDFSFMWYDRPVPVGMAYRRDDEKWGGICHRSLVNCLKTKDAKVQESLAETKLLIGGLGIEWILAE